MRRQAARLPADLRAQLLACAQSGKPLPDIALIREGGWSGTVRALLGAGWVGLVLWCAYATEPWGDAGTWAAAIFSLPGAFLVVSGLHLARAQRRWRSDTCIIATPIMLVHIDARRQSINMEYLRDLIAPPTLRHVSRNGHTVGISLTFRFRGHGSSIYFQLKDPVLARRLIEYLQSTPDILRRWSADGSAAARIRELDWISVADVPQPSEDPAWQPRSRWYRMACAVLLAACSTGAAVSLNLVANELREWSVAQEGDSHHSYMGYVARAPLGWHVEQARVLADDRLFAWARARDTVSGFRKYLRTLPEGRWSAQARQHIDGLIVRARDDYVESVRQRDAAPRVVQGMQVLLEHLRATDNPAVAVCFLQGEGLDGRAIEAMLRRETGSSRIPPISPSFTAERNRRRESQMLRAMQAGFSKVIPDDVMSLHEAGPSDRVAQFLVKYKISHQEGSIYADRDESHLPASQRRVYAGIVIDFEFTLQVPGSDYPPSLDPRDGWRISVQAKPAPTFEVIHHTLGGIPVSAGGEAVYDKMADTAFEDFEREVARAYGLAAGAR